MSPTDKRLSVFVLIFRAPIIYSCGKYHFQVNSGFSRFFYHLRKYSPPKPRTLPDMLLFGITRLLKRSGLSSLAIVKPVLSETPTCTLYLKASLVKASPFPANIPT
jgi:hypothetical protein